MHSNGESLAGDYPSVKRERWPNRDDISRNNGILCHARIANFILHNEINTYEVVQN